MRCPSDLLYLPIWVGKLLHPKYNLEYKDDDTGDNISAKNLYYGELTACLLGVEEFEYRIYWSDSLSDDIFV